MDPQEMPPPGEKGAAGLKNLAPVHIPIDHTATDRSADGRHTTHLLVKSLNSGLLLLDLLLTLTISRFN